MSMSNFHTNVTKAVRVVPRFRDFCNRSSRLHGSLADSGPSYDILDLALVNVPVVNSTSQSDAQILYGCN